MEKATELPEDDRLDAREVVEKVLDAGKGLSRRMVERRAAIREPDLKQVYTPFNWQAIYAARNNRNG